MKNLFFLLALVLIVTSCRNEDCGCTVIASSFNFAKIKDGKYLFDDADFRKKPIRILYNTNGTWKEYFKGNLDAPYGYTFYQDADQHYYMKVHVENKHDSEKVAFKIKFDEQHTDNVETAFSIRKNGQAITTIVYNGVQMQQWQPKFTITQ